MSKVEKEITVQAPVDQVYQAWHHFENFPRFMSNIEEVRVVGGNRSHWKARGPLGQSAEWDAEITLDEPNRAIGWRSIRNAGIETAGRVNFEEMGDATKLHVVLQYAPPAGAVGELVTKIFSNPEQQIEEDLGRFKETIEADSQMSQFVYGGQGADASGAADTMGGSLGPVTDGDLDAIGQTNSGISPEATDDPAHRESSGKFGHGDKDLPPVG